jgi:hypothetical protein
VSLCLKTSIHFNFVAKSFILFSLVPQSRTHFLPIHPCHVYPLIPTHSREGASIPKGTHCRALLSITTIECCRGTKALPSYVDCESKIFIVNDGRTDMDKNLELSKRMNKENGKINLFSTGRVIKSTGERQDKFMGWAVIDGTFTEWIFHESFAKKNPPINEFVAATPFNR